MWRQTLLILLALTFPAALFAQQATPQATGAGRTPRPRTSRMLTPQPTQARQGTPTPKTGVRGTPAPRATGTGATGMTTTKGRSTTTTSSASTKPAPKSGAASALPGTTGQIKEVTKAMAESVKTRKIDYDEEELRENPSVIILNPRKTQPKEGLVERQSDIARPL